MKACASMRRAISTACEWRSFRTAAGAGQVRGASGRRSLNYRDLLVVKGDVSRNLPAAADAAVDGAGGGSVEVGPGATALRRRARVAGISCKRGFGRGAYDAKGKSALAAPSTALLAEQVVFHEDGGFAVPDHLSFEGPPRCLAPP